MSANRPSSRGSTGAGAGGIGEKSPAYNDGGKKQYYENQRDLASDITEKLAEEVAERLGWAMIGNYNYL